MHGQKNINSIRLFTRIWFRCVLRSLAETPLPSNITCMICRPETSVISYH